MFHKILKSKYFQTISLLFIISIAIFACETETPIEPITAIIWQWAELVETEPASQSLVPDSENYTMLLSPDGSLSIMADCNMVNGSYTLDGSSLTIELGPSTMAFCGEESLDQLYLSFLANVERYSFEDGQIVLELKEGAGRITFTKEQFSAASKFTTMQILLPLLMLQLIKMRYLNFQKQYSWKF